MLYIQRKAHSSLIVQTPTDTNVREPNVQSKIDIGNISHKTDRRKKKGNKNN
jgi:hypothetical protein